MATLHVASFDAKRSDKHTTKYYTGGSNRNGEMCFPECVLGWAAAAAAGGLTSAQLQADHSRPNFKVLAEFTGRGVLAK